MPKGRVATTQMTQICFDRSDYCCRFPFLTLSTAHFSTEMPRKKPVKLGTPVHGNGEKKKSSRKSTAKQPSTADQQPPVDLSPKITDFFPVRRSCRRPESELKIEKEMNLWKEVLSEAEEGLKVEEFPGKGRGVIADRHFVRGQFVVEYRGDLISTAVARKREKVYAEDTKVGCYMYYFNHKDKRYCVDATDETKYLGRLVNHSSKDPNCVTKVVEIKNRPHLILVAARDISIGEELLYDYGERSKEIIEANPWLLDT